MAAQKPAITSSLTAERRSLEAASGVRPQRYGGVTCAYPAPALAVLVAFGVGNVDDSQARTAGGGG